MNPFCPVERAFALCRWFSVTFSCCHALLFAPFPVCPLHSFCYRFGPYLVIRCRCICSLIGAGFYAVTCCSVSGVTPLNASTTGHSGPLVPVSPREVAILSGPWWSRLVSPPLILQTRRLKRSGGGDIHRSLPQPSFSSRGSTRVPPRCPGSASEREESMTAWWLAINR